MKDGRGIRIRQEANHIFAPRAREDRERRRTITSRAKTIAKTNTSLISLGIGLVAVYWLADSISRALIYRTGDLLDHVTSTNPLEFWPRAIVGIVFLGCGFYGQFLLRRRKRIEAELRKAKIAAEAGAQAKSEFLANMSHEIRTPMTAILGYGEMMMDAEQTAEERNQCLAIVRRNGEHLLELINDILDVSKIEASKFMIEPSPCSIPSVVADVVNTMNARAHQKGVALSVEYAGPLPETIQTDGARVRQALMNLVGNAVKFTDEGSVRVVVSLVDQWRGGAAISIQVVDTGVGISSEALGRLFEPFVQGDTSTSRKYGGTGLGLVITRHIANLLGGDVDVTSTLKEGSTFTLTIPTGPLAGVKMLDDPAKVIREAAPDKAKASVPRALVGLRVLLAEDGEDNQRLISMVLRKAGAEVAVAANGVFAVASAMSAKYDVVLMDMQMPEMDGYQATASLRRQGYEGPILALTAHAMASDRERCVAAGCNDYLSKPIDRAHLVSTVAEFGGVAVEAGDAQSEAVAAALSDGGDVIVCELGDDCDVAEVIDLFVVGLGTKVQSMREALNNGCYGEVGNMAHQLKGAGGTFGYPQITEAARDVESAARGEDAEGAHLALSDLDTICRAVIGGRKHRYAGHEELAV